MDIRPILSSLRKHRIPALLIVLEICLACAVLCNAVFMIAQRVHAMNQVNAIDEAGLTVVSVHGTDPAAVADDVPRALAVLRAIPGVRAAAAINTYPLGHSGWNIDFTAIPTQQDGVNMNLYMMGRGGPQALGLQLQRGRLFRPGEYADAGLGTSYIPLAHVVVLTHSAAERLWPGQNPLGKTLYAGPGQGYTVVGEVADVLRPNRGDGGDSTFHYAAFFPLKPSPAMSAYLVRSAPQARDRVARAAEAALAKALPQAVVKARTFSDIRAAFFADVRSMAWMLVLVCAVMLAVTAVGIVGLTSFWVQQRRRQIGIRRAVGACRSDILRYFQTENFLLVTLGVALGMAAAWGINALLMHHYELGRLPPAYLPVGALTLWLVGQLAVLGPALRAASITPLEATRSA